MIGDKPKARDEVVNPVPQQNKGGAALALVLPVMHNVRAEKKPKLFQLDKSPKLPSYYWSESTQRNSES